MTLHSNDGYLLAAQPSERERLQLQSKVWEPAGRKLLAELEAPAGARAIDLGCGCLGWLRLLSEWVGPEGRVVGTDVDASLLDHAADFCDDENLANVRVLADDMFDSHLPAASFDLVHARFQIAPLGRASDILDAMLRLVRPGGVLVLEDPCSGSWNTYPSVPAAQRLVQLIINAFDRSGGCFDAGTQNVQLLRERGLDPYVRAEVLALPPGDPYLRLPVQFGQSLRDRLSEEAGAEEVDALLARADAELCAPGVWGTTFTLIQTVARVAAEGDQEGGRWR